MKPCSINNHLNIWRFPKIKVPPKSSIWGIWGIPIYGNPARPWRTWTSWPLRLCRTWTFWHRYIDIQYMGHSGKCTCQTMSNHDSRSVLLAATTVVLLVFWVLWRCVSFEMLSCRASPLQEGIGLDLVDRADRNPNEAFRSEEVRTQPKNGKRPPIWPTCGGKNSQMPA